MDGRVLGGFLGHAVGDALGFPYEGVERESLKRNPITDMPEEATLSDDTAMVICTAKSLCERGIDINDLARRFVGWLLRGECTPHGRAVGVGRTTYEAVRRLASGVPPREAGGTGERDNGNGSLMRMLPLVFYLHGKTEDKILENVKLYSSVTHAHTRTIIACHVYVLFGMALYDGLHPHEAYHKTVKTVLKIWDGEEELKNYSRILNGSLQELPEEDIISSGYVVHTLESALWVLLKGGSFREMLLRAVNLGGDTDTVGAVVGGLAGIYHTVDGIPDVWVRKLPMRGEIEALAGCLAGVSAGSP